MKILVLHEKSGNRYFGIRSDEQLYNTCAVILKERLEEDYWYTAEEPEPLGLSKEEIDKLPKGEIKAEALSMYKKYKEALKLYLKEHKFFEEAKKAIKTHYNPMIVNNAHKKLYPYHLLIGRNSYEYERISLEELTEVV